MVSGGKTCWKAARVMPRQSSPAGSMANSVVTTSRAGKILSIAEYAAALAIEKALFPKADQAALRRCRIRRSIGLDSLTVADPPKLRSLAPETGPPTPAALQYCDFGIKA